MVNKSSSCRKARSKKAGCHRADCSPRTRFTSRADTAFIRCTQALTLSPSPSFNSQCTWSGINTQHNNSEVLFKAGLVKQRQAAMARRWSVKVGWRLRSEEHTSELQSRENLVCRLLLEKKKKETKESKHE